MKKNYLKFIGSICIIGAFLLIALASGEEKETVPKVKTDFTDCSEVISYVKYRGYQSLKEEWGEAQLGRKSLDNDGEFQIDIKWEKVKVNGRTVEFTFTLGQYSTPSTFVSAYCGG